MAQRIMETEDGCAVAGMALVALAGIGWVMNVVKIFIGLGDPVTGMWLMRCLGVIAFPLGCITGWL